MNRLLINIFVIVMNRLLINIFVIVMKSGWGAKNKNDVYCDKL